MAAYGRAIPGPSPVRPAIHGGLASTRNPLFLSPAPFTGLRAAGLQRSDPELGSVKGAELPGEFPRPLARRERQAEKAKLHERVRAQWQELAI